MTDSTRRKTRKPNRYGFVNYGGSKEEPAMPIADAPYWKMDDRAKAARDEVAPAQRVFLGQLMAQLDGEGVNPNDVVSFATEVLAAQVNLIAERLKARRAEVAPGRPELGLDTYANIVVSDIFNRAQLRRLRGDDRV